MSDQRTCLGLQGTGKVWWEVAPVQFTPSFPCRSPPGHTGETLGPPSISYLAQGGRDLPRVGGISPLPQSQAANQTLCLSLALQPGKLTEAFKYFLQGMGYSKCTTPHTPTD